MEIVPLQNRYLQGYINFEGKLIDIVSLGYCFNSWIQLHIDGNDKKFLKNLFSQENNHQELANLKHRMKGAKNIGNIISLLFEYKNLIIEPLRTRYGTSKMTNGCILNLLSENLNVSIILVSEFTYLEYNRTTNHDFSIIIYKENENYHLGLSSIFNYNDIANYKNNRDGLCVSNYNDEVAFNATVSAISNEPMFVEKLSKEELEDILYYLNYKAKENLNIEKKVKKLKEILKNPNRKCKNHNRTMEYPCGRYHCVDCVDLGNKNTLIQKCPCGKIIKMQLSRFCSACNCRLLIDYGINCGNSHYFCEVCSRANSGLCFICNNLVCMHGVYIKVGYDQGSPNNISIDCKSCNVTIKLN